MYTENIKTTSLISEKYQDILHLSRPAPSYHHPRMPVPDRAKIFSPFAALRGYEDEIERENKKRVRVPRKLRCEEDIDQISKLLLHIKKHTTITVRFFQEDSLHPSSPPLGTYQEITGAVIRIDFPYQKLFLLAGTESLCISFDDIDFISL